MLPLADPQWLELSFGERGIPKENRRIVPQMLEMLAKFPSYDEGKGLGDELIGKWDPESTEESLRHSCSRKEIWWAFDSLLMDEGNVYAATFATVPHIVDIALRAPEQLDHNFLSFPAWVEVNRFHGNILGEVPERLLADYQASISKLSEVVRLVSVRPMSYAMAKAAGAALAVASGHPLLAHSMLLLEFVDLNEFIEWNEKLLSS